MRRPRGRLYFHRSVKAKRGLLAAPTTNISIVCHTFHSLLRAAQTIKTKCLPLPGLLAEENNKQAHKKMKQR